MYGQIATITSKRQLTIPVDIFERAGLKEGQRVRIATSQQGKIYLESMIDLVEELAGSVAVPPRFASLNADQMIAKARKERFTKGS